METNAIIQCGLLVLLLFIVELVYFKVAVRYRIVDKPNNRSSHARPVIRGGGIIFIASLLFWFLLNNFTWPWFFAGSLMIAVISFLDDVISLKASFRFLVQALAVMLMFFQLWPIHWPIYLLIIALIVCIGTLNAFNFMDGINGMTGIYALVSLLSLGYIQTRVIPFTDLSLIIVVSISVVIFLFFNFRKKARCFAGDVGSITIAFVFIFFLLQLIYTTHNFLWPLLFLIYGTDAVITIIYRIIRKEDIFKAHRTHLYQYLSNEIGWPHRVVSLLYGGVQILLNIILISAFQRQYYVQLLIVVLIFVVGYLLTRVKVVQYVQRMKSVNYR